MDREEREARIEEILKKGWDTYYMDISDEELVELRRLIKERGDAAK